jgi:hypothetical protein
MSDERKAKWIKMTPDLYIEGNPFETYYLNTPTSVMIKDGRATAVIEGNNIIKDIDGQYVFKAVSNE